MLYLLHLHGIDASPIHPPSFCQAATCGVTPSVAHRCHAFLSLPMARRSGPHHLMADCCCPIYTISQHGFLGICLPPSRRHLSVTLDTRTPWIGFSRSKGSLLGSRHFRQPALRFSVRSLIDKESVGNVVVHVPISGSNTKESAQRSSQPNVRSRSRPHAEQVVR